MLIIFPIKWKDYHRISQMQHTHLYDRFNRYILTQRHRDRHTDTIYRVKYLGAQLEKKEDFSVKF